MRTSTEPERNKIFASSPPSKISTYLQTNFHRLGYLPFLKPPENPRPSGLPADFRSFRPMFWIAFSARLYSLIL